MAVYNFAAGPAMLPKKVMERAQAEFRQAHNFKTRRHIYPDKPRKWHWECTKCAPCNTTVTNKGCREAIQKYRRP